MFFARFRVRVPAKMPSLSLATLATISLLGVLSCSEATEPSLPHLEVSEWGAPPAAFGVQVDAVNLPDSIVSPGPRDEFYMIKGELSTIEPGETDAREIRTESRHLQLFCPQITGFGPDAGMPVPGSRLEWSLDLVQFTDQLTSTPDSSVLDQNAGSYQCDQS